MHLERLNAATIYPEVKDIYRGLDISTDTFILILILFWPNRYITENAIRVIIEIQPRTRLNYHDSI